MDGELENEVKNDIEKVVSTDPSSEKDISPIIINRLEGVSAADHNEENAENMKANEVPVEKAATSEPEENSGYAVSSTNEDLIVKINEVKEQPVPHEVSVHHKTPETENISPTQEEEDEAEEGEPTAARADKEDISYGEYMQLLQVLCEERDKASQHSSRLQMELAEYFHKKARDDGRVERELSVSEQLQEYEEHIKILSDLKQQLTSDSETAQQQEEELSLQSQERLNKVEDEWRMFLALKQDVAVTLLYRCLGRQAAQAKVESILAAEQLRQDKLIKLRLKNIKLGRRIQRLEAELREGEEHARDSLQLQFEQLQAERMELKRHIDKQNEESLKMQRKISSSLEVLSNVKEKLFWKQKEVQTKREQLAEVEATVAMKKDILARTKQTRNSLQRNNLKLMERCGLLGNRVLLRDFEDTVDASNHLEEQLGNLKDQQAEIIFKCGRWKKK
uniref:coiled-coil domain-containing protein 96 n=1 Tax=Scatophagus argus TaxID=75038 RepID=UPI001ED7CC13|nr:coiled-coil domain-containing protein 96 [Scatophagus argus]